MLKAFNIAGYKWLWYDGYGRYCLKTTQAALRLGYKVYPFEIEAMDKPIWMQQAQGLTFDVPTVQLMPPHMMKPLPGRSISYTMHESMNLPAGWADHINAKAEWLFVPSPWLVEVFKEGGVKTPITVVKSGIDPEECAIVGQRRSGPFRFGCLGDRGSRKGFDLVQTAFYRVFDHHNKDVRLTIKCRPGSLPGIDAYYSSDERLTIWRADVEHVSDIFGQFDAFIFPSRCEGWGQPPREAAACGIPTVVTRWSGLDDETDQWAIPLDNYKLVESGMEGCGGLWAEPSLDELCETMLWIYEHQDDAKQRALQGEQWLRDNRTYAQSARTLARSIERVYDGPPADPMPQSNGRHHEKVAVP